MVAVVHRCTGELDWAATRTGMDRDEMVGYRGHSSFHCVELALCNFRHGKGSKIRGATIDQNTESYYWPYGVQRSSIVYCFGGWRWSWGFRFLTFDWELGHLDRIRAREKKSGKMIKRLRLMQSSKCLVNTVRLGERRRCGSFHYCAHQWSQRVYWEIDCWFLLNPCSGSGRSRSSSKNPMIGIVSLPCYRFWEFWSLFLSKTIGIFFIETSNLLFYLIWNIVVWVSWINWNSLVLICLICLLSNL